MISNSCRFSKTICKPKWCKLFPIRLKTTAITPPCFYSNKLDYFAVKNDSESRVSLYDADNIENIVNYALDTINDLEDTLELIKIKSML